MKQKHYIVTALISYLFFAIASTPAATVFSLLKNNSRLPFTIHGIDGSIWNGSAERLVIPSAPQADNINWSINPFALLTARVNASIEAEILKNKLTGKLSVDSSGTISASDIQTQLSHDSVQQLINLPLGEINGDFHINIDSFESSRTLPLINGTILWKKASFTLADTVKLGDINISIKPSESKTLNASIKNNGGDIGIEGQLVLSENRTYKIDLTFKPEQNTKENIKQSLAMFARRQPNGSYTVKQTGNLRSLGF